MKLGKSQILVILGMVAWSLAVAQTVRWTSYAINSTPNGSDFVWAVSGAGCATNVTPCADEKVTLQSIANLAGSSGGGGGISGVTVNPPSGMLSVTGSPCTSSGCVFNFSWSGTAGGMPYFNSINTVASSGLLSQNQLILGGGVSGPPSPLGSTGTTSQVLIGNASGPPAFGSVNASTMLVSQVPPPNGGTGVNNTNTLTLSGGNIGLTAQGATVATLPPPVAGAVSLGTLDIIINQLPNTGAGYTLALSDRGKLIYDPTTGADTITVPANASVAFPIGSTISILNCGGCSSKTIQITTDTLLLSPCASISGSCVGTRTLGSLGIATLYKVTATTWIISGNGVLT